MTEKSVLPTCTDSGNTVFTCADCNYTYVDNIIPPIGHSYAKKTFSPTCENGGYSEYSCPCGHSYISEHTSALGHDFQKVTNAPDCEKGGNSVFVCRTCDYTYTSEYVKPLGHEIVSSVTAPSCTSGGYTTYNCQKCDYSYIADITPPTEHSFSVEVLTEVNCEIAGEVKYTCACGETYSTLTPPQGHSLESLVTMPTLSDMGYTEYWCKNCELTYCGDYRFYSSIVEDAYGDSSEILAYGIDISVYNHEMGSDGYYLPLDWEAIAAEGIDYVILKAGSSLREGGLKGGMDATFEMDHLAAHAAGVDVGAYFYTYATSVEQIRNDAYMLLSILDGKKFEYPIYLDLEDDSLKDLDKALLSEMCVEFFTVLQRAGYYTGLYINHNWLYNIVDTDIALSKFDVWYARYNSELGNDWNFDEMGQPFGMWQYSDKGELASIAGICVDLNVSYKDYPTIITNGGFNGYTSNIRFPDDGLEFVWVSANSLTVRSSTDFDSAENIISYAAYGDRFIVLEKNESYTKILYNGREAYISANLKYISFSPVW